MGIPISGKEPIERELDGVVYLFRHAIGEVERKIQSINASIYNINSFVQEASKKIDADNVGRDWKPGERLEQIHKVASAMADDSFWQAYTSENEARRRDEIFDIICIGWRGECYLLEENERPSEHVRASIKRDHVDWWMSTQMDITGDDQKNSERRPGAASLTRPGSPSTVHSVHGKIRSKGAA